MLFYPSWVLYTSRFLNGTVSSTLGPPLCPKNTRHTVMRRCVDLVDDFWSLTQVNIREFPSCRLAHNYHLSPRPLYGDRARCRRGALSALHQVSAIPGCPIELYAKLRDHSLSSCPSPDENSSRHNERSANPFPACQRPRPR